MQENNGFSSNDFVDFNNSIKDNTLDNSIPLGNIGFGNDDSIGFDSNSNGIDNGGLTGNNSSSNFDFDSIKVFNCTSCGSTFGVNGIDNIFECIFCHGHNIQSTDLNCDAINEYIPFRIDINHAINDYKKKVMLNPVIPFAFKSKNIIKSIKKVYLSGYLFDILVQGNVNYLCADRTPNGVVKSNSVYSAGVEYDNLFNDACSRIEDRVFNAIDNYNFNALSPINTSSLGPCYFLLSDLNKESIETNCKDNCVKHTVTLVKRRIKHDMKKLQENNLNVGINKSKHIFVPVYFLSVIYNGKRYTYMMNGENGNSSLEVVHGALEVGIFSTISVLVISLLVYLILLLF